MLICSNFVGPGTRRGRHEVPFAINANRSCAWSHSQHRKKKNTNKKPLKLFFFLFFTSKTLLILYGKSDQSCTSSALPVKYHKKPSRAQSSLLLLLVSCHLSMKFYFVVLPFKALCASSPRKSWLCFPPTFLTLLSHICSALSLSFAASSIFHTLALHKPCCLKWHCFL